MCRNATKGAIDRYSRERKMKKKKKKKEEDTKPLCSQICFLIFLLSRSRCSSPVYMGEKREERRRDRDNIDRGDE